MLTAFRLRRLAGVFACALALTSFAVAGKPKKPGATAPNKYPGVENEEVRQGLEAFDDVDYIRCVEVLQRSLQLSTLTTSEKVAAHRTLALAHVALGEPEQARRDFENLLRVEPEHDLDKSFAPNVRAMFDEARANLSLSDGGKTSLPVLNSKRSSDTTVAGEPIGIRLLAPTGTKRVELMYKPRGETGYSTIEKSPGEGGQVELMIPGLAVAPPAIDYVVKAYGATGDVTAADGSVTAPLSIEVRALKKVKKTKPWVWGAIAAGLVVVGGVAAGVAVALTRPSDNATLSIIPH